MSSSQHELSESSNSESQQTPTSSPPQQVPNLSEMSRRISSTGRYNVSMHKDDKKPRLRIIEQPQSYFRFRYKSERECGSHGCLMGENTSVILKTHPEVELVNYKGKAVVKCRLFTVDKKCEHPHQLLENDQEKCYSTVVPEEGSYRVCFRGMGIIHTAKKHVLNTLVRKRQESSPESSEREVHRQCVEQAKAIDLNAVVLRFSAHDIATDREICSEYSRPIKNMKSVATNPLKICKYSRTYGRVAGGDDVFLFVDKVSKKNTKVRVFEVDAHNRRIWEDWAYFTESDVHHQYGIVIRTPPYGGKTITSEIKVFIELLRTTDGLTSAPVEFTYKDQYYALKKKRKLNSAPFSPQCSAENTSHVASMPRVLAGAQYCNSQSPTTSRGVQQSGAGSWLQQSGVQEFIISETQGPHQANSQVLTASSGVLEPLQRSQPSHNSEVLGLQKPSTLQSWPSQPSTGSHEFSTQATHTSEALGHQQFSDQSVALSIAMEEIQQPFHLDDIDKIITDSRISAEVTNEYAFLLTPPAGLSNVNNQDLDYSSEAASGPMLSTNNPVLGQGQRYEINPAAELEAANLGGDQMDFDQFLASSGLDLKEYFTSEFTQLKTDSGIVKKEIVSAAPDCTDSPKTFRSDVIEPSYLDFNTDTADNRRNNFESSIDNIKEIHERPAFKPEDRVPAKLTREISEISEKLKQHSKFRMLNGDTLKLINLMKMPSLLNSYSDLPQKILRLAIIHDQPRLVAFLIAKGCDPMMKDDEGNNVIHHAVMCQTALESLLDAIKSNGVACDLEALNYEGQTALHLAAIYDSESSARLLLRHGASYNARDSEGRTPLHLATYDDYLGVTRALLDSVLPSDIDAVDRVGRTALQIACGGDIRKNSFEIIKLLLKKGADPYKENRSKSTIKLAQLKPGLLKFMNKQIHLIKPLGLNANDSDSEEEFFSADEAEGESEDNISSIAENKSSRGA